MPIIQIYNKETKKWLTADEIDDLLKTCLLDCEFEWEV